MTAIPYLHLSRPIRLCLLPVVAVSAVLAVTASAVQADEIRVCPDYGVVRDRNDHEALLLPRRSVAHCARSYQTLYQTYRVLPESQDTQRSQVHAAPQTESTATNSTPPADTVQSENR